MEQKKISVRMDDDVYELLSKKAEREGKSVNGFIVDMITNPPPNPVQHMEEVLAPKLEMMGTAVMTLWDMVKELSDEAKRVNRNMAELTEMLIAEAQNPDGFKHADRELLRINYNRTINNSAAIMAMIQTGKPDTAIAYEKYWETEKRLIKKSIAVLEAEAAEKGLEGAAEKTENEEGEEG